MPKIMHIITRLDMGGSAQNTLLTCRELAGSTRWFCCTALPGNPG